MFDCVMDGEFTADNLLTALGRADVTDLRLLQGAVPCLAPALCAEPVKRHILAELLLSLVETRGDYDDFVADAQVSEDNESMETHTATSVLDSKSDEDDYMKEAMALAHTQQSFTPRQYEYIWLVPPATPAANAAAHGIAVGERDEFPKTGVWALGLPLPRSLAGFLGASNARTDAPDCQHEMVKQKKPYGRDL